MPNPFHLALPVANLEETRNFYVDVLGCGTGRSSDTWIDFDMYGHQVVAHLGTPLADPDRNEVDGKQVPSFHYGVVLDWDTWHELATRIAATGTEFIIEPGIRFEGEPGEQATMFFLDPSGNALEFKAFRDMNQLFATD